MRFLITLLTSFSLILGTAYGESHSACTSNEQLHPKTCCDSTGTGSSGCTMSECCDKQDTLPDLIIPRNLSQQDLLLPEAPTETTRYCFSKRDSFNIKLPTTRPPPQTAQLRRSIAQSWTL